MERNLIIRVSGSMCFIERDNKNSSLLSTFPVSKSNKSEIVDGIRDLLEEFDCDYTIIYE